MLHNDIGMPIVDCGEAVIDVDGAFVVDDTGVCVGVGPVFVARWAVAAATSVAARQHTRSVRDMSREKPGNWNYLVLIFEKDRCWFRIDEQ